jgi:nucleolar pre-ribosomal-associated protein 1
MQLKSASSDEGIAWVKVLENIITVVDPVKLEASTSGEWRFAFCRCLSLLLRDDESGMSFPMLVYHI